MSRERRMRAGGRTLELRRPDKVLFPDDGVTKADLAEYYRDVASRMVPRLRGRPLMMLRYPDGIGRGSIVQKNVPRHFPDWIDRTEVAKEGGTVTHVLCDDAATLVYLANQACVTPHRWLSRADRPDHPDLLVFDLDPAEGTGFEDVRWAAHRVCEVLDAVRLPAMLMTTGSSGLHVIAPLDRGAPFDEARACASDIVELLARRYPDRLTTRQRKSARAGRVYLDVQRNGYAQTAVAPWAVRARPGAPVAMPISRDELDDPKLTPRRWTLHTAAERIDHDPWVGAAARGRSVRAAHRRLARLTDREDQ